MGHRRLTELYSDCSTTCDAVVEQDSKNAPETYALHRKFRIQKDRLITWGVDWSDKSNGQHGDIDDSVEQAGLTETVTSVLGTIKEILDEAERMHPAASAAPAKSLSGEKSRPDPPAWAAADRSRYEELIKDLTTSIDILYDLSRTRRVQRGNDSGASPSKAGSEAKSTPIFLSPDYSASDLTLVNPATFPLSAYAPRSNLPLKLDPSDLILPAEEPPPYESVGKTSTRIIGRLQSRHSSTNPWKIEGSRNVETYVLVEYATYDPTYRFTEVSPPTDRLEGLLSMLTKLSVNRYCGTLKCLGYFEDPKQPRFGLVFELPSSVYSGPADSQKSLDELRPVTLLSVLQTGSKSVHNPNSATPPLEDRFRLAYTLGVTFNKLHVHNFVHKDVNSSNVLVFRKSKRQSTNSRALQYTLRSPVICSFDLFSDYDIEPATNTQTLNIYRHPDDPKFTGVKNQQYNPQFDMYSLGLILLEVGLWQPLADLWKPKYTLHDFKQRIEDVYIRRLASKCGTAYMQVVRDCFWAADSQSEDEQELAQMYNRIILRLQRCCMLDESEPGFDFGGRPEANPIQQSSPLKRKSASQPQILSEISESPSYRSAKRWALEKGSQALERTKSLTKKSPDPSLTRYSSKGSQHSIRKSISESLRMMSPRLDSSDAMEQDEQGDLLEESGTLIATPNSQDRGETSSLYRERVVTAASTIQRAWRQSRRSKQCTLRDYKEKITIIQKAWRQTKQNRTNTVEALLTDGMRQWPQAVLGYPTPEPEARTVDDNQSCITSSIQIETDAELPSRPKLKMFPVMFPFAIVNEWHSTMLPRLERLIECAFKDSDETISIDLVAIGETQEKTRPTIFVTCSSVVKMKALLSRRFRYEEAVYDLKVRRGKIRRSKMSRSSRRTRPPHRSMMNTDNYGGVMAVMNPYHQQKPLCGASIGAFNGEHLPPVSYGGVILIDDEPLGMSVHHLLDAPSDDESDDGDEYVSPLPHDVTLSSAANKNPWLMGMGTQPGLQLDTDEPAGMWDLELSDDELILSDEDAEPFEFSGSEFDSDDESDHEAMTDSTLSRVTTGDINGICPGKGEDIRITQPAIDDVESDFFPNDEDRDDDHLSSHELGHVHASSGIRRWKRDGVLHEIDWALLKLKEDRLQPYNICQGGRRFCFGPPKPDQREISTKLENPVARRHYTADEDEYPNGVASADSLAGLNVHCFGRTTGLQGGMISSTMSAVRIYRRKTFSRSWSVSGGFGVGGDSGAWIVQNGTHRVVGHVLAWCERNHIAYLCPMEVLLEDIKRTLGAKRIYLPGSTEQARFANKRNTHALKSTDSADIEKLECSVQGLGIVDSAVDVRSSLTGPAEPRGPPSSMWIGGGSGGGDCEKENLPPLRSRIMKIKEGMVEVVAVVP